MVSRRRLSRQKGISLIVGTVSMVLLIPSAGLAVDAAVLYYVKARLQGAVDGAALAAARSLNLGLTTSAQATSAKQNAVNWFYANFPTTAWATSGTQMDQSMVQVFDDPNNPSLRNVTVQANTNVSTLFMKWFNIDTTLVSALGNASRRDAVVMMVLDRSSSMNVTGSCPDLKGAAKVFTGQFASGRDRIGLVSFSDGTYVHHAPSTDFRTTLGYDDGTSVGNGEIDTVTCLGGTNTASAISIAYNELYKIALPGAFNVLLVETDGLPNSLTLNWWDTATSTSAMTGLGATNGCRDSNGVTKSGGGWGSAGAARNWTPGYSMNTGGTGYMTDIPPGPVGALYSNDPGGTAFIALANPWHSNANKGINGSGPTNSKLSAAVVPNCRFVANNSSDITDFAWMPANDVYGNDLNPSVDPFLPVTMAGSHVDFSGTALQKWTNFHNASSNATVSAAYRVRTNPTLPVSVFVVGLGGNASYTPDYTLLQRLANDASGDGYNTPPLYNPCSSQPGCVHYPDQPQGSFIWSVDKTELRSAFLRLSSQILRLSR